MNIEFSIGPGNKEEHYYVLNWLKLNNYNIKGISFKGDHYSEIHIENGDYNKAYDALTILPHLSLEHWD